MFKFIFESKVLMKTYPICYMIENFLIHETVLVFLIELLAHSHSLTYFQVLLVSVRSDG